MYPNIQCQEPTVLPWIYIQLSLIHYSIFGVKLGLKPRRLGTLLYNIIYIAWDSLLVNTVEPEKNQAQTISFNKPILDLEWTTEFFNVAIFLNFLLLGVILDQIPKTHELSHNKKFKIFFFSNFWGFFFIKLILLVFLGSYVR